MKKGILNNTCVWCAKQSVNDYGETTYSAPETIPCAIGTNEKLKQTDIGLVKLSEIYFILHDCRVKDGDKLNDLPVVVEPVKNTKGVVQYYRAVVLGA